MNREILFRAKRTNNGEWIEGYFGLTPKGRGIVYEILKKCDNPPDGDPMWRDVLISYDVDPSTVCQYTGLTDKNGRKIFEGDILSAVWDSEYTEEETFSKVVWEENGFRTIESEMVGKPYLLKVDCDKYYKVKGNVFDNPELLEVLE